MPASGYRPLSTEPTSRWGRWLIAQRKQRGWSQTRAFEELHEGLRLSPKSRTSYRTLEEGGRQPKDHEAEYLTSIFGAPPDDEPETPTDEAPSLAAALSALAAELRASREARDASEARLRAVEAGVALLARRAGVELPEQSAPPVRAG